MQSETIFGVLDKDFGSKEFRPDREFEEWKRYCKEASFFRRNPGLRKQAISTYGLSCYVCKFNFAKCYGSVGDGFVEIHHENPLAERIEFLSGIRTSTTVENVKPVCSNCHRMLHRETPAMSIRQLAERLMEQSSCRQT